MPFLGISFLIDMLYDNCTVKYLGSDVSGDIIHGADGSVTMTSPFEYWHSNQKFAKNGKVSMKCIFQFTSKLSTSYASSSLKGVSTWITTCLKSGRASILLKI